MKNLRISFGLVFIAIIGLFSFPGCIKDNCTRTYTYTIYEPLYKTKAEVRANIKSNPARALKNPGKIYIRGNTIFLNEIDKGIHVIDNSNPSHPVETSFIDIPGNLDIAVKGNTLYADLYTDLVSVDITDPSHVQLKKVIENVFPYRAYAGGFSGDSSKIIVEWSHRDTIITEKCDRWMIFRADAGVLLSGPGGNGGNPSAGPSSPIGIGGSMARFTILNDRLYAVTTSQLEVFNISAPNDPLSVNHINLGWNIETIYPFKNKLFIGSQNGMYIFNAINPDAPVQEGRFSHIRTCDPVIADDHYAYVTLRSGTPCQGFTNELDILLLNNITNPSLLKVYQLTNPHGLSKDGNTLFICDGTDGLKVYDASDVNNLQFLKKISGIETFDVIAYNNVALVVATGGLYQYDYSDPLNIRFLSKISILK